jgi:hypothetical protein
MLTVGAFGTGLAIASNDPAALPLMRQLTVSDADVSYRVAAMRFLAEHGDEGSAAVAATGFTFAP